MISRKICGWKSDLRTLQKQAAAVVTPQDVDETPLEFLHDYRDDLHRAEPALLSNALQSVIESVMIWRESPRYDFGGRCYRRAVVTFRAAHFDGEPVSVQVDGAVQVQKWQDVADYVFEKGRAVLVSEVADVFDITSGAAGKHLRRATSEGLLTNNGHCKGWSAKTTAQHCANA